MTWRQVASNIAFSQIYGIDSKTIASTSYYVTIDQGNYIYRSTGNGSIWAVDTQVSSKLSSVSIGRNGYTFVGGQFAQVYHANITTAARNWTQITLPLSGNPVSSNVVQGISTYDGVNVIAMVTVSNVGQSYYSSNSGTAWTLGSTGATSVVYCVAHGSSSFAMAAGASAYVARTYDGGMTWTKLSVFASSSELIRFQSLSVISTLKAYVVGNSGNIFKTQDAGSTWIRMTNTGVILNSISMLNEYYGVAGATATKGGMQKMTT